MSLFAATLEWVRATSVLRCVIIAYTVIALIPAASAGQLLPIPNGASAAEIIVNAEQEGGGYQRAVSPSLRGLFATPPAGTTERRCVEVIQDDVETRSGEFLIGGHVGGNRPITAGRTAKIWWVPLHGSLDMPPLVVRGRSLTSMGDTLRVTNHRIAFPVPRGGRVPEAEREYFYPSSFLVPQPGRWLLIATSGPDWGCFIVTVK